MISDDLAKLVIHLLQEFQPVNAFYPSILIEEKKFTLSEITNKILPFFFYSSLLTMSCTFILIELLGQKISLICASFCPILILTLLLVMKERNFLASQFMYGIGGGSTAFKTVLRSLLIKKGSRPDKGITKVKKLRYATVALAGWIGQGIYDQTHSYEINIDLSLILVIIAFLMSIIWQQNAGSDTNTRFFQNIDSLATFFKAIRAIYTKKILMGVICGSMAACLQIYLGLFSQTLFIEKKNDQEVEDIDTIFDKLFAIIHIPMHYISVIIVRFFCLFSDRYKVIGSNIKRLNIASGYIEGTTKIIASFASGYINSFVTDTENTYLVLLLLSIIFFFMLGKCKFINISKFLYVITLTLIMSTETLGKSYAYNSSQPMVVLNICLFSETIIHTSINLICRYNNYKTSTKRNLYSIFACALYLLILIIKFN